MAIYSYTLKKYLKAKSTWVITIISALLIGFLVGGFLPFSLIDETKDNANTAYTTTVVAAVAGVTSFMSIFASVFAGFKAASMYKDEVEDGTFLVLLSKPMKRSTIIFMKWLALQTVIIGYTLITVLFWALGVFAFDKGDKINTLANIGVKTATSQLLIIAAFVFVILFTTGLIFSSIALLLSTKLSVGSTIGISIALGVVIPITSLVGAFTKKDEFKKFDSREVFAQEQILNGFSEVLENVDSNKLPAGFPVNEIAGLYKNLSQDLNKFRQTEEVQRIYKLGIATGETNTYNWAWAFDLNYQISTLSQFAYEKAIPEAAKDLAIAVSSNGAGAPGLSGGKNVQIGKVTGTSDANGQVLKSEIFETVAKALHEFQNRRDELSNASFTTLLTSILTANLDDKGNPKLDFSAEKTTVDFGLFASIKNILKDTTSEVDANPILKNIKDLTNVDNYDWSISEIIGLLKEIFTMSGTHTYEKMMDEVKYEDPSAVKDVDWTLYHLNKHKDDILSLISTWSQTKLPGKLNGRTVEDNVFEFVKFTNKLESPISTFLVKGEELKQVANDNVKTQVENAVLNRLNDGLTADKLNIGSLTKADKNAILELVSAEHEKNLVQVESGSYVDKTWLLVGYLALALLLVPIAYLVVKKQDFR